MNTNELAAKIRELKSLQNLAEEAEAEAEAIRVEIKAFMGDAEELRAGEYKVTWKTVQSSRLDIAALKKELPDLAERFTTETVTRRFVIS